MIFLLKKILIGLQITVMKKDIQSREDIVVLVDNFYEKVQQDEIGYFFNEVAQIHWEHHLPKMYAFWEQILFQTGGFKGNPLAAHQRVHALSPFSEKDFKAWVSLFHQTVDELFEGSVAELAKQRAESIAQVMMVKVIYQGIGIKSSGLKK